VYLIGDNLRFQVEPGSTLLSSALVQGIQWPHKCKVGSCGTCKCKIVSGKVKSNIDLGYVLDPEQLKQGFVLACQSELTSDIEVEVTLKK
jgi:xylene monooxygenase electron transfer component